DPGCVAGPGGTRDPERREQEADTAEPPQQVRGMDAEVAPEPFAYDEHRSRDGEAAQGQRQSGQQLYARGGNQYVDRARVGERGTAQDEDTDDRGCRQELVQRLLPFRTAHPSATVCLALLHFCNGAGESCSPSTGRM